MFVLLLYVTLSYRLKGNHLLLTHSPTTMDLISSSMSAINMIALILIVLSFNYSKLLILIFNLNII